MSIEKFILRAFNDIKENDLTMAFYSLIPVIDATASKRYPGLSVGERTKKFLRDELSTIIYISTKLEVNFTEQGGIYYGEVGEEKSIEHWIYKLIRNPLVHDAKWNEKFEITYEGHNKMRFGYSKGIFLIPDNYIIHLPIILVGAIENSGCDFNKKLIFKIAENYIDLNSYWGKIDELRKWRMDN